MTLGLMKSLRISMNYKNLNYEIETVNNPVECHRLRDTMNYKNLNYEIETDMSSIRYIF